MADATRDAWTPPAEMVERVAKAMHVHKNCWLIEAAIAASGLPELVEAAGPIVEAWEFHKKSSESMRPYITICEFNALAAALKQVTGEE